MIQCMDEVIELLGSFIVAVEEQVFQSYEYVGIHTDFSWLRLLRLKLFHKGICGEWDCIKALFWVVPHQPTGFILCVKSYTATQLLKFCKADNTVSLWEAY